MARIFGRQLRTEWPRRGFEKPPLCYLNKVEVYSYNGLVNRCLVLGMCRRFNQASATKNCCEPMLSEYPATVGTDSSRERDIVEFSTVTSKKTLQPFLHSSSKGLRRWLGPPRRLELL